VWSYDFVSTRTHDGRSVRLLNLIDEHTRESLLVRAERRWSTARVISALADVMVMKGVPEHLRSDNGPEFVAKDLRKWLAKTGAKTLYIEPGSHWENGYCESFNSKLRDEFLNGEIFYSMKELRVLAERWRVHYNTNRPHSSLGYRSPAPEAWLTNNKGHGEVETATRFPLPTSPHPRRRLLELRNSCATLTHPTAQKTGHSTQMQSGAASRDAAPQSVLLEVNCWKRSDGASHQPLRSGQCPEEPSWRARESG
jgi:putative transposase